MLAHLQDSRSMDELVYKGLLRCLYSLNNQPQTMSLSLSEFQVLAQLAHRDFDKNQLIECFTYAQQVTAKVDIDKLTSLLKSSEQVYPLQAIANLLQHNYTQQPECTGESKPTTRKTCLINVRGNRIFNRRMVSVLEKAFSESPQLDKQMLKQLLDSLNSIQKVENSDNLQPFKNVTCGQVLGWFQRKRAALRKHCT
jgi:hypothetical protein